MRSEVFVFLVGCLGVEPSLRFVLARESLIASPPCLWPLVQSVSFCRWQSDFAWQVRHVVALRREMLHGAVNRPLAMPTAAKHVILKVGNVTSCGAALRSNLLRSVSRVSKSHHHRAYGDCCKSCRFEGRAAGVTLCCASAWCCSNCYTHVAAATIAIACNCCAAVGFEGLKCRFVWQRGV